MLRNECVVGELVIYNGLRKNYQGKTGVVASVDYDDGIASVCFEKSRDQIPCIVADLHKTVPEDLMQLNEEIIDAYNQIKKYREKIELLQSKCYHPKNSVMIKHTGSTGNLDPDEYWDEYTCSICKKFWIINK